MYARSYTPVYTKPKEQVIAELMPVIQKEWRALMENPQWVDLRRCDKDKVMKPCIADHKTIFFDSNFKDRSLVRDMFSLTWYECREVTDKEKSIPEIRHFHAVKSVFIS
jgi:hypothetical protein